MSKPSYQHHGRNQHLITSLSLLLVQWQLENYLFLRKKIKKEHPEEPVVDSIDIDRLDSLLLYSLPKCLIQAISPETRLFLVWRSALNNTSWLGHLRVLMRNLSLDTCLFLLKNSILLLASSWCDFSFSSIFFTNWSLVGPSKGHVMSCHS